MPARAPAHVHVQAAELLAKVQGALPREVELIRAMPEADTISAFLGGVKLAMPGLQKVQTAQRARRKGAKG